MEVEDGASAQVWRGDSLALADMAGYVAHRKDAALAVAVVEGAKFGIKVRFRDLVLVSVGGSSASLPTLEVLRVMLREFQRVGAGERGLGDGRVDYATFESVVRYSRVFPDALLGSAVGDVVRLLDRTGAGRVSYVAFCTHLATLGVPTRDVLEFCFDAHDVDGDAGLAEEEVGNVMRNLLSGRLEPRDGVDLGGSASAFGVGAGAGAGVGNGDDDDVEGGEEEDVDEELRSEMAELALEASLERVLAAARSSPTGKLPRSGFADAVLRDAVLCSAVHRPIGSWLMDVSRIAVQGSMFEAPPAVGT